MDITIKRFEEKYTEQCADLEQYLWKEDKEMRLLRFRWTYIESPNYSKNLSIIAVNEQDEVIGFRGLFVNTFIVSGKEIIVAQIADTIVSPKARRMGIFNKMNVFALQELKKENVGFILDTGPSWPPYHGYKKLGFEDLAHFHNVYKFYPFEIIFRKFKNRGKSININQSVSKNGLNFFVTSELHDDILRKIQNHNTSEKIHSSLSFDNLKWRTNRPNKDYIFVYAINNQGLLESFMMFSTTDYSFYSLGLLVGNNIQAFKQSLRYFEHFCNPVKLMAWDFAIKPQHKKALRKMRFYSIPFLNKIKKNPPALVYSLQERNENTIDWSINGVDIRDINNWYLSRIDMDSF